MSDQDFLVSAFERSLLLAIAVCCSLLFVVTRC